jgi:CRP/FNR family transcriptional regulator, cyclic AMP receptor protein
MSIHPFEAARFLRMQPWFPHIPAPLQERVLRTCTRVRARKGEVMLRAGEPAQGWYALLSGFVKLQAAAGGDDVAAFLALTGGEWFGEGSVLRDEPRRYEVVALRDTELLCLPRAQFHELLAASLPFSHAVLHHMNQRLSQAMAIIEANRSGSLEQRLALYLGPPFWHGLRTLNLSQQELGTLAGMSRQSTNKALRCLEARGLITLRFGRVLATTAGALEEFAGTSQRRWDPAIAA